MIPFMKENLEPGFPLPKDRRLEPAMGLPPPFPFPFTLLAAFGGLTPVTACGASPARMSSVPPAARRLNTWTVPLSLDRASHCAFCENARL